MLASIYIEDIFLAFADLSDYRKVSVQPTDIPAIISFQTALYSGNAITQSQAGLLLKFLQKYKAQCAMAGLEYEQYLENPQWKKPFRVIDYSKRVWIETDDAGVVQVCLQFPYQLKKEFDQEFGETRNGSWDPDRRVRKLILYKCNLIQVYEFVKKYQFEVDDTMLVALGEVEEIWQNSEDLAFKSYINDGEVFLANASEDITQWWNEHRKGDIANDLFLAKSMGFHFNGTASNIVETISSSKTNCFWIKDTVKFLNLCATINGKICIIMDRAGHSEDWLKHFAVALGRSTFNRDEVRVCFRADKGQNTGLNDWIKQQGFGGKIEGGRLLIFNHKPAKWLFKEQENVKLLASNNLYQPTNSMSRDWFDSHPCAIYIGDIKPSINKENKIVEL